jgi:cob(I)alamin adenosyltransferase
VVVASGDAAAVSGRLSEIEELGVAWRQQQQQAPRSDDANDTSPRQKKKTGGRHGGRLTDKNVPYTRGGDKGTSQLLTGERRSKADDAFEAMGTVDELCSFVGVVHAQLLQDASRTSTAEVLGPSAASATTEIDLADQLLEIMSRLFDIGSHVAKPAKLPDEDDSDTDDSSSEPKKPRFVADGIGGGFDLLHVEELEDWIDTLTEDLPELRSFLLPTGTLAAAHLHTARCVCRRAERCLVPLVQDGVCDPTALQYVNRLSDYLFSAARWVNVKGQQAEIQYQRPHQGAKQRRRVHLEHQDES